jgi:hypothetical protein
MSILEDIVGTVEKIADKIVGVVNVIIDWTKSPEGQAVTKVCVEAVTIIVKIFELVNPTRMTGDEKREATRKIVRFIQAAPPEVFDRLAELNRIGDLDNLTYAQLDGLIGNVISGCMEEKHEKRRKSGKTR